MEANEQNLKRFQEIYNTIKGRNAIFERFERIQRQLERKQKKGSGMANFNREEQMRHLYEERKRKTKENKRLREGENIKLAGFFDRLR
ncbi:hypothetical protein [Lederbergia lenta]|nr:hypothetical protein [Lederbergia lenta]MCM3112383.1 hypothetical protein [Lederbergia lenta]MEC2326602.1 hypothetical protein [Lederbergia lenta]